MRHGCRRWADDFGAGRNRSRVLRLPRVLLQTPYFQLGVCTLRENRERERVEVW